MRQHVIPPYSDATHYSADRTAYRLRIPFMLAVAYHYLRNYAGERDHYLLTLNTLHAPGIAAHGHYRRVYRAHYHVMRLHATAILRDPYARACIYLFACGIVTIALALR